MRILGGYVASINKWQKLTNQRTQILEYLQTNKNHPTADEIYKFLKPIISRISLSTIYRNLQSLTLESVIEEIKTPDKKMHYEIKSTNHAHFYCQNCKKLSDLSLAEIFDIKNRLLHKGYQIKKINIIVIGICLECSKVRL
jgi:Fur family peroxide stress response transcriptional regulator